MTANQIKGKGFGGALRYNLDKVNRGAAELIDHTFASSNEHAIMKEIKMIRTLRPNLQKFFYHTSLNFPPSEELPTNTLKQIAQEYMEACGFTQHPSVTFRHYDADHPHVHILVSRIGFDGSVLTDSNDYCRSEQALRSLELKYNLTQVASSSKAGERAMTKNEWERMKRTNMPSDKMKLQVTMRDILKNNPASVEQFIAALRQHNINVFFNQASTGYVSGITYEQNGFLITGTKLGAAYKWTTLKDILHYEQERDRTAIHQANQYATATGSPRQSIGTEDSLDKRHGEQKSSTNEKSSAGNRKHTHNRTGDGATTRNLKNNSYANDSTGTLATASTSLATLLDDLAHGNPGVPDYQPHLDNSKRIKRKRKRRSR